MAGLLVSTAPAQRGSWRGEHVRAAHGLARLGEDAWERGREKAQGQPKEKEKENKLGSEG